MHAHGSPSPRDASANRCAYFDRTRGSWYALRSTSWRFSRSCRDWTDELRHRAMAIRGPWSAPREHPRLSGCLNAASDGGQLCTVDAWRPGPGSIRLSISTPRRPRLLLAGAVPLPLCPTDRAFASSAYRCYFEVGQASPDCGAGPRMCRLTRMSTRLYRVKLLGAPRLRVADVSTAPAVIATRPATGSNSLPNQLLRAVAVLALRLSPCPFPDVFISVVRRSALDWCPTASDRMKRPRSSRRTYRLWVPVSMSSRFAMVMSSSRHSVHSRLHEVKENHQATAVRLRLPCTSPFLRRHEAPGR